MLEILRGRQAEDRLDRLIVVEPFYSIEAWLYQNTTVLLKWYEIHHPQAEDDLQKISQWIEKPGLIDEVEQIKGTMVIGSNANIRLATEAFPSKKVVAIEKSFAAAVADVCRCAALRTLLCGESDGCVTPKC